MGKKFHKSANNEDDGLYSELQAHAQCSYHILHHNLIKDPFVHITSKPRHPSVIAM